MTAYTALGKEVLYHGKHYADTVGEVAATLIAEALNAFVGSEDDPPEPMPLFIAETHSTWRERDGSYACSCGARWDADEGSDHP